MTPGQFPEESRSPSLEGQAGSSPLSPKEQAALDEVLNEPDPTPSDSALRLIDEARRGSVGTSKVLLEKGDDVERVRRLEFVEVQLDPAGPIRTPDFLRLRSLYDKNLLSNEAIEALMAGDESLYISEMERGRMLNRLVPNDREHAEYVRLFGKKQKYESVEKQMVEDMLHHHDRNGDYFVFALRDPATGDNAASVSIRVPSTADRGDSNYQKYSFAMSTFLSRFTFRPSADETAIFSKTGSTAEIDTVNVDPAYYGTGVGTRIMYNVAETLRERGKLPESIIYYRASGFKGFPGGSNMASAIFFNKLGFTEVADRSDEMDWVVRELSPEKPLFVAQPTWALGHSPTPQFLKRVTQRAKQKRLIA